MNVVRRSSGWLWGRLESTAHTPFHYRRAVLLAILAGAFALRLGLAVRLPTIHYADEVYQVAEPATRALHGYGIVSWEFREHVRAAMLSAAVLPVYALPGSATTHRIVQAAMFAALSLIPVWVAFRWAGQLYGMRGAVLAAVMMATWFELVYFGPKSLPDAVSSYLLIAAVYFARPSAHRRELSIAGGLLALALAVRLQVAPAVGLVFVLAWLVGGRERRVPLVAGALAGLTLAGLVEYLWWGVPFEGHIGYLRVHLMADASGAFGREPVTFFLKQYALILGAAVPAFAALIWIGARRAPVVLLAALAVVAPFHLIAHKEYRFVVAASPLFVLLMGLAAADLLRRLDRNRVRGAMTMMIAGWIVSMATVCYGDYYRPLWTRYGNHVLAFETIGADPDACGVALVGIRWSQTPGESGIGRDVPIYEATSEADAGALRTAANYVLLGTKQEPPPAPYVVWREYARPSQFLYRRPGGCVLDAARRVELPPAPPGIE